MEKRSELTILKKLRMFTFLVFLLTIIAMIINIFLLKGYGITQVTILLDFISLYLLIPLLSILVIVTFVYNIKHNKTRTKQEELIIKQIFWGRVILLILAMIFSFTLSFFTKDYNLLMLILFVLVIVLGQKCGKLLIKNN